jgi:hypothetical protein
LELDGSNVILELYIVSNIYIEYLKMLSLDALLTISSSSPMASSKAFENASIFQTTIGPILLRSPLMIAMRRLFPGSSIIGDKLSSKPSLTIGFLEEIICQL